uniref:Uncharacterized protein n=1 Tax=Parascaris equorum TaxID=6256 RepID=A0A914RRP1_PAREQ
MPFDKRKRHSSDNTIAHVAVRARRSISSSLRCESLLAIAIISLLAFATIPFLQQLWRFYSHFISLLANLFGNKSFTC